MATRGWSDDAGAGCLTTFLAVAVVALGFAALLEVSATAASLWLLGCLALGTWRGEVRRRERRQEELARRRARQRARGQHPVLGHLQARRRAGEPIGASSPLPRQWSGPVRRAHAAVHDYRAGVAALPAGPVRDRLDEGMGGMELGATQLEAVARRGAELERQLNRFRKDIRRLPPGAGGEERARAERLADSVASARAHVEARLATLCSAALEVADAAVALSVTDADRVVDGVEDAFSSAHGMAAAVEEVRAAERARADSIRFPRRPGSGGVSSHDAAPGQAAPGQASPG